MSLKEWNIWTTGYSLWSPIRNLTKRAKVFKRISVWLVEPESTQDEFGVRKNKKGHVEITEFT